MKIRIALLLCSLLVCVSCATYYQRNLKFNNYFISGDLQAADGVLEKDKKAPKHKNKLIYYMNRGLVNSMQGNYTASNDFFEQAYRLIDSYHTNYLNEGAAFLLNAEMVEYKGEDFETLYIFYYKAFNYLKLGQPEEALVECKRMNNRLNVINDKYSSKNKFQKDAFIHLLMGIIYDANHDPNNAFIAYRNAFTVYEDDYAKFFGMRAPLQLKKDLMRAAYLTGLNTELAEYEQQFAMRFNTAWLNEDRELVLLWHRGMCPLKSEWSVNFTVLPGQNGFVTFANAEYGWSFPFYVQPDQNNPNQHSQLSDLKFLRVAFPKFVERPAAYQNASLTANNQSYTMEMVEDINAIAFKSLEDRMLLEFGKSLLRMALKKSAEYALRKENQNAGALLGVFNALTERADTRQWGTLPNSIFYTRVPLQEGKQTLQLVCNEKNNTSKKTISIDVEGRKGQTSFHTISTMDVDASFNPYAY